MSKLLPSVFVSFFLSPAKFHCSLSSTVVVVVVVVIIIIKQAYQCIYQVIKTNSVLSSRESTLVLDGLINLLLFSFIFDLHLSEMCRLPSFVWLFIYV